MPNAEELTISSSLTNDSPASLLPPKIFAQPFRLALKRGESDDVTWIEVRSLAGLRSVFEKIEKGELTEIDRFSSVEMQLWGLVAEHGGFLRVQGSASSLAAGIQPLGDQAGALADDFASLMGGSDVDALKLLGAMQNTLKSKPLDRTPMEQPEVTHEFVKPDGVNLTEAGEDALLDLVFGNGGDEFMNLMHKAAKKAGERTKEGVQFQKNVENAIQIFLDTPAPTADEKIAEDAALKECVDHPDTKTAAEICKENAVPLSEAPKKVGPEYSDAGRVGHLIDVAVRGFDQQADEAVRAESEAAMEILGQMLQAGHPTTQVPFYDINEFALHYGTSIDELKKLADAAKASSEGRAKNQARANSPLEARQNQEKNFLKLMASLGETALERLVAESPVEPMTPEEQAAHDARVEAAKRKSREHPQTGTSSSPLNFVKEPDQPYGADHYKPREVKPADPNPRGADVQAKVQKQFWEEQRRLSGLDTPKSNEDGDSPSA